MGIVNSSILLCKNKSHLLFFEREIIKRILKFLMIVFRVLKRRNDLSRHYLIEYFRKILIKY